MHVRDRVQRVRNEALPATAQSGTEEKQTTFREKSTTNRENTSIFFRNSTPFRPRDTCRPPQPTAATQKASTKPSPFDNSPMTTALRRKKNQLSQQKEDLSTCLSRKMILLLPKPHRKTPYGAPIALALCATSLPTQPRAVPIVGRPSWAIIFHHLISL